MYLQICPRETDVSQHRVKLKDNTPIRCKPYPLRMLRGKSYGMMMNP